MTARTLIRRCYEWHRPGGGNAAQAALWPRSVTSRIAWPSTCESERATPSPVTPNHPHSIAQKSEAKRTLREERRTGRRRAVVCCIGESPLEIKRSLPVSSDFCLVDLSDQHLSVRVSLATHPIVSE